MGTFHIINTAANKPAALTSYSDAIQTEINLSSLQLPKLRDIRRANRKWEKLNNFSVELPRIIAVEGSDEAIIKAESFIRSLSTGTKIGICGDMYQNMSNTSQEFYANNPSYTKLALIAKETGLEVVRIEKLAALYDREARQMISRIDKLVIKSQHQAHGSPEWTETVAQRLRLLFELKLKSSFTRRPDSAWRGELLARSITHVSGWKASDIIICNTAQALDIAKIFNTEVSQFFGSFESDKEFHEVIATVAQQQNIMQQTLRTERSIQKLLFAIRHPINFWKAYIKKQSSSHF
jgi:hypothetical protein